MGFPHQPQGIFGPTGRPPGCLVARRFIAPHQIDCPLPLIRRNGYTPIAIGGLLDFYREALIF